MRTSYSRLARSEEKKNLKKAFIYVILSIISLILLVVFGIPALAKMAALLSELGGSTIPVEKNDTTPPAPPKLSQLPEATNNKSLEITGISEPGATIILAINGDQIETVSNKDGKFTYNFKLLNGENSVFAKAKDSSGNESLESDSLSITYDDTPPDLEITTPGDGSHYYGSKQRQIVIQGNTESTVELTINDRFVVVDENGSFTFATTLSEGENKFKIKAKDKAGNETEKELTLQFSL